MIQVSNIISIILINDTILQLRLSDCWKCSQNIYTEGRHIAVEKKGKT